MEHVKWQGRTEVKLTDGIARLSKFHHLSNCTVVIMFKLSSPLGKGTHFDRENVANE